MAEELKKCQRIEHFFDTTSILPLTQNLNLPKDNVDCGMLCNHIGFSWQCGGKCLCPVV